MKKFAKVTAPRIAEQTFAPAIVRIRNIENGISGSFARDSITRNATRSTADAMIRLIVQPEPQPWFGASDTAYTSSAIEDVTATAPAMSGEVERSPRLSRTKRGAS